MRAVSRTRVVPDAFLRAQGRGPHPGSLALERMRRVAVPPVEPEIERQEREPESLVLRHVPALVLEQRRRRIACRDDDVAERDRRVSATRKDEACEAAIRDVEETTAPERRPRERERANEVSDRVGVVPDQTPAELNPAYGASPALP